MCGTTKGHEIALHSLSTYIPTPHAAAVHSACCRRRRRRRRRRRQSPPPHLDVHVTTPSGHPLPHLSAFEVRIYVYVSMQFACCLFLVLPVTISTAIPLLSGVLSTYFCKSLTPQPRRIVWSEVVVVEAPGQPLAIDRIYRVEKEKGKKRQKQQHQQQ